MTPALRWLIVGLVAVTVVAPSTALRLWPAPASSVSAEALLAQVDRSSSLAWSGEVHTQGALQVPVSDSFNGVSRLLGSETSLRVWWQDGSHWRVDRTRASGETDLFRRGEQTASWTYESARLTLTPYSAIRLPDEADVLPATLARRLLQGARPGELSRLPTRRVAGHDSAGLRLVPADSRSTIARVDVWADRGSGLPTRVDVYADHLRRPVLSTAVTHLDVGAPAAADLRFPSASGVEVHHRASLDDAAGANAFAPFAPPARVAGLSRRGAAGDLGAVGVYGRGPTALIAIPLRSWVAIQLRRQLLKSRKAHDGREGVGIEAGPLSLLLSRGVHTAYLLAGTVTPATLRAAARDLRTGVRFAP